MVSTLFLVFNHTFTPAQEADARASLGVERIEPMPAAEGAVWGHVPADAPEIGRASCRERVYTKV